MICCNRFTSYIISSFCFDIIFCAIQMGFAFNPYIMFIDSKGKGEMFIASFFIGCFRCSLLIRCFHTLTVCCKEISWLSTIKIKIFLTIRRFLIVTYKYITNYNGNFSWSNWSRRLINVRFFHKILWLEYFHF